MSKPSNPYDIVIQNNFFKDGLKEIEIYNYWLKKKNEILQELDNSYSIFYIMSDKNDVVVRRKQNSENLIKLTPMNYEKLVNGRLIGILRVFENSSNFGVIDIDSPESVLSVSTPADFEKTKEIAAEVYDYFNRLFKCRLLYTGKNGFHIRCHFTTTMNMNKIKSVFETHVKGSSLKSFLTKRNISLPNIDLSPNMKNGGFIIPHSLNKIGLPCVEVNRKHLESFKRESLVKEVRS